MIETAVRAALTLCACLVPPSVAAQETRIGQEGFESPTATIEQMDWLVGQWQGEGIRGAPAMESWLPPIGGTMVGTFVQESADGAIMFTEHMYIVPQDGSLALKLKHFNADLTGWEEKDDMLTFRLVDLEYCAAYFNALTLRCDGSDGIVAAVRMRSDKPEPVELVFRFRRRGKAPFDDCGATTTLEHNDCFSARVAEAESIRDTYLAAAREAHADDAETLAALEKSEQSFTAHMEAECTAIWSRVREGTIRTSEYLLCEDRMLRRRAHAIWKDWLGRPFTETDLPEPELP